jgi:hypothetical protein
MPVHDLPRPFRRCVLVALLIASVLLVICFGYREGISWRDWGDLHPTSGTWIATASDASFGLLYRPIYSSLGYGGCRYAPLRSLIQAALLRVGMGPIGSTFLIGIASMAALLAAAFVLMRQMETPAGFAAAMMCFILAAGAARLAVLAGLSDVLAAALNFWGIIAVVRLTVDPGRHQRIFAVLPASTLFVLALLTKITSIFGIVTALVWLLMRHRGRLASKLAVIFLIEALVAFFATQLASHGRFLSVFAASALAGGAIRGLGEAPIIFFGTLFRSDPVTGGFWIAGVIAAICSRPRMQLATLLLMVTTAATVPIFGTPGTDINHLLDLEVASLLCVAACFTSGRTIAAVPVGLVIAMTLYSCDLCLREAHRIERDSPRAQVEFALADAAGSPLTGPLLSENPLLPILAGERPYLLDGFMFAGFASKRPEFAANLLDDLDHRRFRAVILAPSRGIAEAKLEATFTHEVMPRVRANYELVATDGRYLVFLPRSR